VINFELIGRNASIINITGNMLLSNGGSCKIVEIGEKEDVVFSQLIEQSYQQPNLQHIGQPELNFISNEENDLQCDDTKKLTTKSATESTTELTTESTTQTTAKSTVEDDGLCNNLEQYIRRIVRYLNVTSSLQFKYGGEKTVAILTKMREEGVSINVCTAEIDDAVRKYLRGDLLKKDLTPSVLFEKFALGRGINQKLAEEAKIKREEELQVNKQFIADSIAIFNEVMENRNGTGVTVKNSNAIELLPVLRKSGYTLDDIRYVCEVKKEEWQNDPKMERYLRIETLFNKKKFVAYRGQKKGVATGGKIEPKYIREAKKVTYGVAGGKGVVNGKIS